MFRSLMSLFQNRSQTVRRLASACGDARTHSRAARCRQLFIAPALIQSRICLTSAAVSMPPGGTPPSRTRFDMIMSVKEHEMHHRGQLMLIERMIGELEELG